MDNKPYVIGLDLGGTNSVFGIVDADANVIASTSIRTTGQNDIQVYIDNCCKALEPLIEKVGGIDNVKSMGIGAPNGELVYGCDGFAGELGHVIVDRSADARLCGCGRKGCLEAYCSATGVARTAREFLTKRTEDSELRDIPLEEITSKDVSIAAEHGDQIAKDIYKFTGELLGRSCANFTAFCSPEAYVFFGGLTKAGHLIMDPIKEAYDANVQDIFKGKAKFLISQMDDAQAAVLGAAALAWKI